MTTQLLPITFWQSKPKRRPLAPRCHKGRVPSTRPWGVGLFGLLLALLLASPVQANELSASVDRTNISIDDRITLTLRAEGLPSGSGPDMSKPNQDVEILTNQSQRSLSIVNGQQEAWLEWNLRLAPRRTGSLIIPPLEIGGLQSQAITILVTDAPVRDSRDEDIFIETEVDKDSVHVQEQLLFTVRLFSRINLEGAEIQPLDLAHAVIKAVDETTYITEINQRDHLVLETTFAVFPQRSGELVIPPVVYDVAPSRARQDPWSRIYGGPGPQRLRGPEVRVPVKPIASAFSGDAWLPPPAVRLSGRGGADPANLTEGRPVSRRLEPVKPIASEFSGDVGLPATEVRFSEHWSTDPDNLPQGGPVTRRITLYADGLTAAQLPAIPYGEVAGVNQYPDQPQTDEEISADGVTASVTQTLALVPNQTGRLSLPEISLSWWDTATGQVRQATLPARELRVSPVAGQPSPAGNANLSDPGLSMTELSLPRATQTGLNALHWGLLGASGLLLIIVLWLSVAYLRLRQQLSGLLEHHQQKQHRDSKQEKSAWAHLKRQANIGTLSQVGDAFLGWARSHWKDDTLNSLSAVAELSHSPGLKKQLQALDRSLFSDTESVELDRQALIQEADALRVRRRKQNKDTNTLPPLYRDSLNDG